MLTVRRIDSLADLTALGPAWSDLFRRCPGRNLFLTHDWARTWWEFFGKGSELWILVVCDGSEPVGIAPMMLRRESHLAVPVRVLGLITNRHVSRTDFIIPERREEVFRALVEFWQEMSSSWDMLRFPGVPGESGTTRLLVESIAGSRLRACPVEAHKELCFLPVSGTWEEYLAGRSRNFRRNHVRLGNRLNELPRVAFELDETPASVDESMTRLFSLQGAGADGESRRTGLDENERQFHRTLAARFAAHGGFQNRFIVADGTTIAGLHSLVCDGVLYALLTSYSARHAKASPGRNILGHTLAESWRDPRIRRIDLNGSSAFLRTWTDQSVKLENLTVGNDRPYSKLVERLRRTKKAMGR